MILYLYVAKGWSSVENVTLQQRVAESVNFYLLLGWFDWIYILKHKQGFLSSNSQTSFILIFIRASIVTVESVKNVVHSRPFLMQFCFMVCFWVLNF